MPASPIHLTPLSTLMAELSTSCHVVAIRDGQAVDAATFVQRAAAWRATFARRPGEMWAMNLDDVAEFCAALFGAWHAGKTILLPGDTCDDTLARIAPLVDGMAGSLPGGISPDATDAVASTHLWQPLDASKTRLAIFTSGSTGAPSSIMKQLGQFDAELHTLETTFGARMAVADGTVPTIHGTVSAQHIYGLLFCALWPLASRRPFHATRLPYHEDIARACSLQPAVLVSSPAHLKRLPELANWKAARPMLRLIFSSGGPLPAEAADTVLAQLGQSPVEVFGSSETGGIAWRQRVDHGDAWQVFPGIEWRGDADLLSIRSPHLADAGWWTSADRIEAVNGHSFLIKGRTDRIVKLEEKRISLTRIEQCLLDSPLIDECRAVVVPLEPGERIGIAAVLTPSGQETLAQHGKRALSLALRAWLSGKIEHIALPRRWAFLSALPANPQGKTTEAMLQKLFRPAMPSPTWLPAEPGKALAQINIDPRLAVFDGHFPGTPIVPGVALVDWAIAYGRQRLPVPDPQQFIRLEVIKFQQVLRPGDTVRLELEWLATRSALAFRYVSPAGNHGSGRIVFSSMEDSHG